VQLACGRARQQIGHLCVADEHYVPTLLAAYNMSDLIDHIGLATFTDWWTQPGTWHPRTFFPGDVRARDVVQYMRSRKGVAQCAPRAPLHARAPCGQPA
jgi:Core-2/I-Branching enzyme